MNWISTKTRPDISFDACELSSVFDKAKVDDVLCANKVVENVQSLTVAIKFPKISKKQLSVGCYSYASFGNLTNARFSGRIHNLYK